MNEMCLMSQKFTQHMLLSQRWNKKPEQKIEKGMYWFVIPAKAGIQVIKSIPYGII